MTVLKKIKFDIFYSASLLDAAVDALRHRPKY